MSDNIEQTFGLDASQALQSIAQLDSAFQKLGGTVNTLGGQIRQFNTSAGAVNSAAQSMGSSFNSAAQQSQSLGRSLNLLAKIEFTQVAIKSLRAFENTAAEAVQSAIKFQTSLAEVQTIANGSLGSLGQLSSSVRQLSDNFNVDIQDATKGLYQSLSLGFGQKAPEFLSTAATLAKAGVSTLEDSVNTLGGALNAYGKDVGQADLVSSQLVKTVQLGAVRLPDLAGAMGRVNTSAAELGVSLPEVLSAFASITVRGVKASEAATQIRATFTALEKATPELTEVLRQNGFASAQAAIATLGYGGTLKLIYDNAGGSQERLAKLLPNIRGFAGVLSLAGEGSARFAENLSQIRNVTADLASQKAGEVLGVDAQKVQSNINQLKNAITVDLGQSILSGLSKIIDLTGGVTNLEGSVATLAPALGVATVALSAYGTAALFSATSTQALISKAGGLLALGALAYGAGNAIGNKITEHLDQPRVDFDARAEAEVAALKKANSEKLQAADESDRQRIDSALDVVRRLNVAYLEDVQNAAQANQAILENAKKTTGEIIGARSKYIQELGNQSEKSREIARTSTGRVADLQRAQSERTFNDRISGQSDADQVAARLSRAIQQANDASSQLGSAGRRGDQFGIDQALKGFGAAQHEAEIAQQVANRTKNRDLEVQAAARLKQVTDTQISAERQLQQSQSVRQGALSVEQDRQTKIRQQLVSQAEIVAKNSELFDKQGNQKPQATLDVEAKRRQAALQEIAKLGFSQKDLSTADALGLTKFVTEHQQSLVKQPARLQFEVEEGLNSLKTKLQGSFDNFQLKIKAVVDTSALEKLVGHAIAPNPDAIAKAILEGEAIAQKGRQQVAQKPVNALQANRLRQDIGFSLDNSYGHTAGQGDLAQQIKNEIATAAKSPAITDSQIQSILGKLTTLAEPVRKATFLAPANPTISTTVDQLSKALGSLNDLKNLQGQQRQAPTEQPVQDLNKVLPAFDSATSAAENLAAALSSAAAAAKTGGPQQKSFGGLIEQYASGGLVSYFAGGGAARGTDTVPAMLTPGEFVVNAQSTGKFYSQLQSINAGREPNPVGAVTHIDQSIGDINVNSTANPKATAREVIDAIRREQRRGSGYATQGARQ